MPDKDEFDKIILNETVYIYKKPGNEFFSKRSIELVFKVVKEEKKEDGATKLYSFVNRGGVCANGKNFKISGVVLRYFAAANFTSEYIKGWEEIKLGYLFLIDFKNYLIVSKRNISGLSQFTDLLEPLPYKTLLKRLYSSRSLLESYGMDNMDYSSSAMKSRKVAADNLLESFNYVGANTYILNFLRIHNDNDRFAISVNMSKLSKSGEKSQLLRLVDSCALLIRAAENFVDSETPLDVFALPYDYAAERDHLLPTSLTLLFNRLIEDMENEYITGFRYEYDFRHRAVDIRKYLTGLSQYIELEPTQDQYTFDGIAGAPSIFRDVSVKLNPKSIRINSPRLRQLKVIGINGSLGSIVEYINNRNNFFVAFEECEFRYHNRSLFKNSKLLGSIDQFLDYFEPDPALDLVTAEKGHSTAISTQFDQGSAFGLAENKLLNCEYLVLDDLGGEWADHIAIDDKDIIFIHSKANDSVFSATAFTEIIGQAQKNMGALNATENMIRGKAQFWASAYRLNNANTQISRLRRGASVAGFLDKFISLTTDVNSKKRVYLNINFISKGLLTTNLNNLRNNINFGRKREAIQILWQISSLISSCYDHGIGLKIWCKP